MFSGGDNGAQAPQDNTAADPAVVSDNGIGLPDVSQPAGAPPTDPVPEAAELPIIAPSGGAPVTASTFNTDDLLGIKQQALQQLSPLLGHLDQAPEERFRTTMMMIQASDDSTLLRSAYEAAQQIGDEKARAQALLDIVNEINYFTQHEGEAESDTARS
jgi:hypothetical protein